ncbi:MAG: hypothetical protein IH921_08720 [Gemmatimonadetes bacterium]|nr:hypothetical protein [Gemmatimonadota bacterium]
MPLTEKHDRQGDDRGHAPDSADARLDELESLSQQDARVEPTDFLPRTRYSVEALLSELGRRVAEIGDPGVKQLVERVLARVGVDRATLEMWLLGHCGYWGPPGALPQAASIWRRRLWT